MRASLVVVLLGLLGRCSAYGSYYRRPPPPSPSPPLYTGALCNRRIAMAFVLDRSGSMSSSSIHSGVRLLGHTLISQLDLSYYHSRASVVTFSSTGTINIGLSYNRGALANMINTYGTSSMPTSGYTNIADGLNDAQNLLRNSAPSSTYLRLIVLLSDGEQSSQYGGSSGAIATANAVKAAGTTIFAVGFGGVSQSTLNAMASSPSSQHSYLGSNVNQITSHFQNNLCALIQTSPSPPPPPPSPSPPPPPPSPSPPAALCSRRIAMAFVLDRSGSMSGYSIASGVRSFGTTLINQLDLSASHSRAGVVTFSSSGRVNLGLTYNKALLTSTVNGYGSGSMRCTGSTNIGDGLHDAASMLQAADDETYLRLIVLLSDGEQSSSCTPLSGSDSARHVRALTDLCLCSACRRRRITGRDPQS